MVDRQATAGPALRCVWKPGRHHWEGSEVGEEEVVEMKSAERQTDRQTRTDTGPDGQLKVHSDVPERKERDPECGRRGHVSLRRKEDQQGSGGLLL